MVHQPNVLLFIFYTNTATSEIYTLSLHDALPILVWGDWNRLTQLFANLLANGLKYNRSASPRVEVGAVAQSDEADRKSTRLNSSHVRISYAVFCLKKKNTDNLGHDAKDDA